MLRCLIGCLTGILLACCSEAHAAEKPIATFAVLSNPYITTLPPAQIKDERGVTRDFLASTGPASLKKAVTLVNQIKPDALIVLGSITWTGSQADFRAAASMLSKVNVPYFLTPGHRDRLPGNLNNFQKYFSRQNASHSLKSVNGVQLVFADDLHGFPDQASRRMNEQLSAIKSPRAVLLFGGMESEFSRSKLTESHPRFWKLIEQYKIAAEFEPTRYSHRLGYPQTLPKWHVGSTAWSSRGAVTVARVFSRRIEITQVTDPTQQAFTLTIPNPVNAPRMKPAKDDPYGCPSYSLDLASRPDFTFALVSDPQFDRKRGRETLIKKSQAAIRELNRLSPKMVFVSGDLVNNNLPEEWKLFQQEFSKLKSRYYVAPGNHDVLFNYNFVEASYSRAPKQKPEYAKLVKAAVIQAAREGFTGPTALYEKFTKSKPRQLVEYKDCAFIIVSYLTQRIETADLKFLRDQLKKTSSKKHVFVIAHYPTLPAFGNNVQPKLGGTEALSLLREHKVIGNLFGHRHRNGFRMHEGTAHVLSDNMRTIHLFHVFPDRIVIGRKQVGVPLYEKITLPAVR
ncbi:MAG: hypothetical protein Tsb009_04460 [Planctomycetaceae bacterium]